MNVKPRALETLKWWPFIACLAVTWGSIGWIVLSLEILRW